MPNDIRPAHGISIKDFESREDEFESWVKRFESAVKLAHNTDADADALNKLCIEWLPLKLDKEALSVYNNVTPVAANTPLTWADIKTQLGTLLINPQDKYNWLATRRGNIVWDGKESFHALATRVKTSVDKFDPNCDKNQEYYFRFRSALTPDYRKAIDLGCREETIEEAKRVAYRFLNATLDQATGEQPAGDKAVSFTGAAMSDDRIKTVELSVQSLGVKVENLGSQIEKLVKNRDGSRDQSRSRESSRDRQDRNARHRSQSRGADSEYESDSRGRRDDRDRNSRRDRHERASYRSFSNDRDSRRDYRRDESRRRDFSRRRDDSDRRGYRRDDSFRRDDSYSRGYRRNNSYGRSNSFRRDDSRGYSSRRDDRRRDYDRGESRGRRDGDDRSRRPDSRDRRDDRNRGESRGRDRRDSRDERGGRDRDESDRRGSQASGSNSDNRMGYLGKDEMDAKFNLIFSALGIQDPNGQKSENK